MRLCLLTLVFLFASPMALAAIDHPLRHGSEFPSVTTTKSAVERVKTAKIIAINYALLAQDFPQLKKHLGETDSQWKLRLDAWVLAETPFILQEHVETSKANSKIEVDPDSTKTAYRPRDYNRAHVLPVPGGLIDAKGTGMAYARPGNKTDGLASLGEMIREYLWEDVVARVFRHSGINARTIGNYAVLDLGFDIIHTDQTKSRAGMILRQAHIRSTRVNSSVSQQQGIEIESTLRRYGLTSSGETMGGAVDFDYINIQGTGRTDVIEILDFGAFMAVEKFTRPWKSLDNGHVYPYANPGDAKYIQPDPALRIDLGMWGDFGNHDPKDDKPWRWSHELAQALAEGRADRAAVERHLQNFIGPVETKFHVGGVCHATYH